MNIKYVGNEYKADINNRARNYKRAKEYAKDKNRSLSDIIENYLKILTKEEQKERGKKLNPIVKSLKGSFKMPIKDMDYKKELRNRLEEKYFCSDV